MEGLETKGSLIRRGSMYANNAYFGAQCMQIGPTLGYLEPQGYGSLRKGECQIMAQNFAKVSVSNRLLPYLLMGDQVKPCEQALKRKIWVQSLGSRI